MSCECPKCFMRKKPMYIHCDVCGCDSCQCRRGRVLVDVVKKSLVEPRYVQPDMFDLII